MLNIEKYKDEIKAELEKDNTLGCVVNKLMGNKCDYYPKCNDCYLKVLDWLLQEYKEPILTDKEKEILKNISRRFDNIGHHIITIKKKKCFVDDGNLIFKVKIDAVYHTYSESDLFYLDKKFKGMELEKEYTLEELGL